MLMNRTSRHFGGTLGRTLFPELEEELRNAAKVKHIEPIIVVLGNPPYEGYSSAETMEERQMLAPWIEPLWPQWGLRKHRLNDLYVRFWRIAIERIVNLSGRGVVSFITNRKWLGGRSYPAMRQAIVEAFERIRVDDLHGAADDATHPGDQSIFTTSVASGITRGTAIVTAVRTQRREPGVASIDVRRREYRGSADAKREELVRLADSPDDSYQAINVSRDSWWRFTADREGDDPPVDDYLTFFRSGVQPVRDEAVLAFDSDELQRRMTDYFDNSLSTPDLISRHPGFGVTRARYNPARTRQKLLIDSHYRNELVVPFLYRPFDVRWMYWEPQHKLLNEPRRELIAYWTNVPRQRCLVLPQTPRRKGAVRPVVSSAVASFAAAEPDARLFPLYRPVHLLAQHGAGEFQLSGAPEVGIASTLVAPEWAEVARSILDLEDDIAGGEAIFYALITVMNAPAWIDSQPVDLDDFPQVPLPADRAALAQAVDVGRQLADLYDPMIGVQGVTTGRIQPQLTELAIPDSAGDLASLEYGSLGRSGGRRVGNDILWSEAAGWRNVPESLWTFAVCGFPVLSKWLSYRVTTGLTASNRNQFMLLVRRLAAIREFEPACNSVYRAAQTAPLNVNIKPSSSIGAGTL
jgi:predicted helicase